jgi:superfamily I DNA/RNA helicase
MQATDILGSEHKFDALIVDEGQDFHDLWWTSLDGLFRDSQNKACYYVFFDPNQNLYVDSPTIPGELGPAYELPTNCRNTVKIAQHCAALVNQLSKVREGLPLGDEPEIVSVRTMRDGFMEAGKRVRAWCMPGAGGLKTSQVAVLAPGSSEPEWPEDFGTVEATRNFNQWRNNKGVMLSSWHRFKGLEADAIVIIETPRADGGRENANRYVARSRAKHLLTIIKVDAA